MWIFLLIGKLVDLTNVEKSGILWRGVIGYDALQSTLGNIERRAIGHYQCTSEQQLLHCGHLRCRRSDLYHYFQQKPQQKQGKPVKL